MLLFPPQVFSVLNRGWSGASMLTTEVKCRYCSGIFGCDSNAHSQSFCLST